MFCVGALMILQLPSVSCWWRHKVHRHCAAHRRQLGCGRYQACSAGHHHHHRHSMDARDATHRLRPESHRGLGIGRRGDPRLQLDALRRGWRASHVLLGLDPASSGRPSNAPEEGTYATCRGTSLVSNLGRYCAPCVDIMQCRRLNTIEDAMGKLYRIL